MNVQLYKIKDFLQKGETGKLDRSRSLEIAVDLAKAAMQHPDKNLLVDLRDTTVTARTTSDVLALAIDLQDFAPFLKNKIAALVPDETHRLVLAKTLEACMQSKGANYQVFTEHEEAIKWFADISEVGSDVDATTRKPVSFGS